MTSYIFRCYLGEGAMLMCTDRKYNHIILNLKTEVGIGWSKQYFDASSKPSAGLRQSVDAFTKPCAGIKSEKSEIQHGMKSSSWKCLNVLPIKQWLLSVEKDLAWRKEFWN
jgi:hypothetical protein